ncbi:MAG: hypothetical protein M1824_001183 [Vezdaea acicularis]|nr:MAG: hypothetical protein M1824_001183 [Vezdaea acicularis]
MGSKRGSQEEFKIYQDPSTISSVAPSSVQSLPNKEDQSGRSSVGGDKHVPIYDRAIQSIEIDEENTEGLDGHSRSRPGSALHSSGPSGDEAIFDGGSRHSSPATSHNSDEDNEDVVSEFPEEHPLSVQYGSPYTPIKQQRSAFRNPSSVQAMQLENTPPFDQPAYFSSPRSPRYKLTTPSCNGTPRSTRSQSLKPKPPPKKKEYPLVLLHVTLLPINLPYPLELMMEVLPPYIIENYNLLKDKANDTLLERGILLPHPREDYELLEERLLESLELKLPRILRCGHFHRDEDEEADSEEEEECNIDDDADICVDCGRRVRDGKLGTGYGHRRWNIKIFAANGLMRAGAWAAAWKEMERVDVEIEPWIPEELRKEMKLRMEEEAEHNHAAEMAAEEEMRKEAERVRFREIYGEEAIDEAARRRRSAETARPPTDAFVETKPHVQSPRRPGLDELPLATVLQNYIYLLLQDKRNLAIAALSFFVIFLALGPTTTVTPSLHHHVPQVMQHPLSAAHVPEAIQHPLSAAQVLTSAAKEQVAQASSSYLPDVSVSEVLSSVLAKVTSTPEEAQPSAAPVGHKE